MTSPSRTPSLHEDKEQVEVDLKAEVSPVIPPTGGVPAAPPQLQKPGADKPIVAMSRLRFVLVFGSLMLCVFLFALDQLIISTAIPKIVSQFNSLPQIAWLTNGFFITLAGFVLLYAQILSVFPAKWVLLGAVALFELGSLVCGVAPSMAVLIFGRALAGVGAAGIFSSSLQIIIEITTLAERSTFIGLFGACFGLASVLGPLVGGSLTDHVSWRWCFYINLPIGGLAAGLIFIFLEARPALGAVSDSRPFWKKCVQLDWVGTAITICHTVCITLALQYGGVQRSWKNGGVIALLVMIPVSFAIMVGWTMWIGQKHAMLPLRFLRRRVIIGAAGVGFFGWMTFMAAVNYLAVVFQAVYGDSATGSGVDLLSLIVVQTVIIVLMGKIVAKFGHYKYMITIGPLPMMLGNGLIYYAIRDAKTIKYIMGFQVFIGIGVAFFLQNINIAAQVEFRAEPRFISRAMGIVNYFGFIGRILGVSVSTSIFNNLLKFKLVEYAPTLDKSLVTIVRENIVAIRTIVPEALRPGVIQAYRQAIAPVFLFAMVAAFFAFCFSWFLKNDSTHPPKKPEDRDVEKAQGLPLPPVVAE